MAFSNSHDDDVGDDDYDALPNRFDGGWSKFATTGSIK